jgi:Acetyltransferase (GNAT) domain
MGLLQPVEIMESQSAEGEDFFCSRGGYSKRTSENCAVKIVDPVADPSWDRAALLHPEANLFHSAAWARVLNKTYRHKSIYLQFCRKNKVVALVPMMEVASPITGRRGVSLPFSDFCQPLFFDSYSSKALITETVTELARERGWQYFELRRRSSILETSASVAEQYYGHQLDLTIGCEELFSRFDGSARRAIRKAEKSGSAVEISQSWEAMADFYRLHVRTRRRHGLPPQPLSFFRNIHEEVIQPGWGFVVVAKAAMWPVAAAVFFCFGRQGIYKFGASEEKAQKLRGNNLVMWGGIKRLAESGLQVLHFGRTETDNEGLRRFKLSWGTKEEMIHYFRFALREQAWQGFSPRRHQLHHQLFRRLPLAVNRFAGALIYPHID